MSREKKYYAVKVGKVTGILNSWEECKDSVHNYPGAVYKSFKSEEEAKEFLDASDSDKKTYVKEDTPEKNYAYVDGSINPETGAYGAGGFLIDNKGEKHILQGSGSDPEMMPMRNVAGEILGARIAIDPTTRVLIHEKSSLAPPGETLAFKLGDEEGFRWIGAYDINADDLLNGKEGKPTETKLERGTRLMEELLKDGKKIPLKDIQEKAAAMNISSRTMRDVRNRMGERLVYGKGTGRENTVRLKAD